MTKNVNLQSANVNNFSEQNKFVNNKFLVGKQWYEIVNKEKGTCKQVQVDNKQGYIDYLDGLRWSYWCTGTTSYELKLRHARTLIERYQRILENNSVKTRLFWVAEQFNVNPGYHLHYLMFTPNIEYPYKYYYNAWQQATGMIGDKWQRISMEKYDTKKGAGGYCSKYINKEKADYDMITNISYLE